MKTNTEVYLGDGLYARFDGFQIWLRAPRDSGNHEVALEGNVVDEFLKFIARVYNVNIEIKPIEKKENADEHETYTGI